MFVLEMFALSVSLIATSPAMCGEEDAVGSQPRSRYTVLCRWIDKRDEYLAYPAVVLAEGEKGNISDTTQHPFVTALTRVTAPDTKEFALQPQITVLDEGRKIDLIVSGRQPHGASIEVTVEQLKVTEGTRQIDETTTIHAPCVNVMKKRVFDFLRFGEPLVVPLGEKRADGTMACLEVVVRPGENAAPDSECSSANAHRTRGDANVNDILAAIVASGGGRVLSQRLSRWEEIRGHHLDDDLASFKDLCTCASLYSYLPHRAGMVDGLALLSHVLDDPVRIQQIEDAVLGGAAGYTVVLWDSPSLVKNVERLADVPRLWDVTIRTHKASERLLQSVKRLRVLHHLEIYDTAQREGRLETPEGVFHSIPESPQSSQEPVVMGGVTPRIIIEGEEEERLGILPLP